MLEIFPGATKVPDFIQGSSSEESSGAFQIKSTFDIEDIKREKDKLERAYILKALNENNWRVSGRNGVASLLKMNPSTLESRMRKLNIKR